MKELLHILDRVPEFGSLLTALTAAGEYYSQQVEKVMAEKCSWLS